MGQGASADAERYQQGYPGQEAKEPSLEEQSSNLQFYRNEISSEPDGAKVETIHKDWWGDYDRLEVHHGYIQWLFPIREPGMNPMQPPLTLAEAKAIAADPDAVARLVRSYELMLDFYGFKLVDKATGAVGRHDGWKARFANLAARFHNNLRITRILKSLGEMGFEHYKVRRAEYGAGATKMMATKRKERKGDVPQGSRAIPLTTSSSHALSIHVVAWRRCAFWALPPHPGAAGEGLRHGDGRERSAWPVRPVPGRLLGAGAAAKGGAGPHLEVPERRRR